MAGERELLSVYSALERRAGRLVWVERVWLNLFGARPELLPATVVAP